MHPTQHFGVKVTVGAIGDRLGVGLAPNLDPRARRVERDLLGHERLIEGDEVERREDGGRRGSAGGS